MNINEALAKIKAWDPEVFKLVKNNLKQRNYGLVYERNLPEAVCLWNKQPAKFDKVYCLPPRGVSSKDKSGNVLPEYSSVWVVDNIDGDVASLVNDTDTKTVDVHDIVPVVESSDVIYPGLHFVDKIENGDKDYPYHVLINAENYHALEMLRYAYAGKVDCIYIDPPYNTGAKDWKYNNDYVGQDDEYRHSKWLMFMERRLRLAKDLLNPENSVLIVTIDEKEYLRLGMLLEQLFPEARVDMVSSVISRKGSKRRDSFSKANEFIYFVKFGNAVPLSLPLSDDWYINKNSSIKSDGFQWGSFVRQGSTGTRSARPKLFYPIFISNNGKKFMGVGEPLPLGVNRDTVIPPDGCIAVFPMHLDGTEGCWSYFNKGALDLHKRGFLRLGNFTEHGVSISYVTSGAQKKIESGEIPVKGKREDGSWIIDSDNVEARFLPICQWNILSHDASYFGTNILTELIGKLKFPYPKSLYAVEDCLRFFVADKPNALIIDFFAGSGTTAHATMLLNHLDGGHRRCISITNNEVGPDAEKEFTKQGLRPTDKAWQEKGIAKYITWERMKAAITGIATNGQPIKGNYKFTEEFSMSEGFKENAIFFDLTYENLWDIKLDRAFNAVAPILWMTAGCKGPIIEKLGKGYATTDYYAVLFKFSALNKLVEVLKDKPTIEHVFAVTNDNDRFAIIQRKLTMIKPQNIHRLYESYLNSFEIVAEGGLD